MEAVNNYNVHKNQTDFTRVLKFTVLQSLRLIEQHIIDWEIMRF